MKKILSIALVMLFAMTTMSFAGDYSSPNVNILGRGMGPGGVTPPSIIVKIRYGLQGNDTGLSSGDVVVWDTTSADGYTISGCIVSHDATFAGVLVEDIATSDSSRISGGGDNVGYMCIQGYCLAQTDRGSTAGEQLSTSATAEGTGGARNLTSFSTPGAGVNMSVDIGVLLETASTTADGLRPVWLK